MQRLRHTLRLLLCILGFAPQLVGAQTVKLPISVSQVSGLQQMLNNRAPAVVTEPPYNARADKVTLTDAAITSGSTSLTSAARPATSGDVGKTVLVVAAGASYNVTGAWASSTAYAMGDHVTYGGYSWTTQVAHTSGSYFVASNWSKVSGTKRALMTTVASVSNGAYVLAATASNTVSNGTAYIASDDTAAVQKAVDAMYAAGGGNVTFPKGVYTFSNVIVKSRVTMELAPGTTIRQNPNDSSACFYIKKASGESTQNTGSSVIGDQWTFDCTGLDPIKGSGTITNRNAVAVYAIGASNYAVRGCTGLNVPLGNAVQNDVASDGTACLRGEISDIRMIDGPYGYGCVQVDAASFLNIRRLYSNGPGYTANIEADTPSSGPSRVVTNVNVYDCTVNSDYGAISNNACQASAHDQSVQYVTFHNIRASGGASGFAASYSTGGTCNHILVDGLYVSGGGQGWTTGTNTSYTDFVIQNFWIDGTNSTNLSNSLPNDCISYAPGMTIKNGLVQNCLGNGASSTYWDGSLWPSYGNLSATLENVRIYACGTPGSTYNGIRNLYAPSLILDKVDIQDEPVIDLMPLALKDCQISGSESWGSLSGTASRSRVTFAGIASTGTVTNDGTNVSDGNTLTIGNITYRFKSTMAQAYDVQIGASATATMASLTKAINVTGTVGSDYYAGTYQHPDVTASVSSLTVTLTAAKANADGNLLALSKSASHLSVSASTLSGGADPISWHTAVLVTASGSTNGLGISSPFHSAGNQYMIPCTAGQTYKFAAWGMPLPGLAENAAKTSGINLQATMSFYDDNGNSVSTTGLSQQQSRTVAPGVFTYVYAIKTAPVGATYCQVNVSVTHVSGRGNPSPGESFYLIPGECGQVFTTVTATASNPQMSSCVNLAQGTKAHIVNSRLSGGSISNSTPSRVSGSGFAVEANPRDPQGLVATATRADPDLRYPKWQKFTVSYKDLVGWAATTGDALVFPLPVRGIVHGAYINVTTAFAGTSTLTAVLGITGTTNKYLTSTNLMATGVTNGVTGLSLIPESLTGGTNILLTATSSGGNLSALSGGSVDVYILTSYSP